ncbi:MAG: transposase [Actinomycetota bacterium]
MGHRRDLSSSTYFHISNRGADRQDVFGVHDDWAWFEERLDAQRQRHGIVMHAYAWMTNHFHLLIEPVEGSVSDFMRDLSAPYARRFNVRTARTGPLFDGRFFSRPVPGEEFHGAARYVHRNPIDIVGEAGLASYERSSLPAYLGIAEPRSWLETSTLASLIDPTRYLSVVLKVERDDVMPIAGRPPLVRTSAMTVLEAAGIVVDRLGPGVGTRSRLAALVCAELRIGDVVDMSEALGLTPSTFREYRRRGRHLLRDDPGFAEVYALTLDEVAQLAA